MIEDDNLPIKNKFLNLLSKHSGNIGKASKEAGRTRQTFYGWAEKDPSFKEAIKEEEEARLDTAEEKLQILIKTDDFKAIKFFLETKGRHRGYDTRVQTEVNLTLKDMLKPREISVDNLEKDDVLNLRDIIRKSKSEKTG